MAINAEQLNIILAARDKEFTKAMDRSQKRVEMFAKKSQRELDKTSKSFGGLGAVAGRLGAVLSTGALAAGMAKIIDDATRAAVQIDNLSRISGTGIERFQELAFASKSFGIEQDKLADILKDVNDKFGDYFSTGAGPLADFFEQIAPKIGLTADAFKGLSSDQALGLYVKSLQQAGVSQSQLTFYMEALASDATALAPLFANNSQKLNELSEAGRTLGAVIDQDIIAKSVNLRRRWDEVVTAMQTKFNSFVMNVAIGLDDIFGFTDAASIQKDIEGVTATIDSLIKKRDEQSKIAAEALGGRDYKDLPVKNQRIFDRASAKVATYNGQLQMTRMYLNQLEQSATTDLGELEIPLSDDDGVEITETASSISSLASELDGLLNALEPAGRASRTFAKQQETINELVAAGIISRARGNALIAEATAQMKQAEFAATDLHDVMQSVQGSMESAFMGMVDGTMTAKDAFRSMAADIIKELYRVLVVQRLVGSFQSGGGGILGSIFSAFGGKASGGPVQAGQPYVTGEHGRELFVPSQSGRVLSVAQSKDAMGGGGGDGVTVIQNNTFGSGVTRAEVNAMLPKMVEATKAAVADAKLRGGSYGGAFA